MTPKQCWLKVKPKIDANIITGKEVWESFVNFNYKEKNPKNYDFYYRTTKYSDWQPADFSWCVQRDYFYEKSVNTGKHSKEICINVKTKDKRPMTCFLWELDQYAYDCIGMSPKINFDI